MTLGESTITATLGLASSGMVWLVGQADAVKDMLPEGIITGGALMTGAGFSIWYCYYVTKVILPQKDKEHRESVKEIIDTHNKTIGKMTDDYKSEMKLERDEHEKEINRIISLARLDIPADASRPANR
jgi:hypothetical protein